MKLTASDAAESDGFGGAVALDGSTLVIGAINDDDAGERSGSVYVFERTRSSWVESAKLTASDGAAFDGFGWSVAIDGNAIVVGAFGVDDAADGSGAAYVFERTSNGWVESAKLTASDAAPHDYLGESVAIDGDTVVVGAAFADTAGEFSGAAYVYERTPNGWEETSKLTASDAANWRLFGWSAAMEDDTIVIGAPFDDDFLSSPGSAYVFERTPAGWVETALLTASETVPNDNFGWSVGLDADTIVVTAPGHRGFVDGPGIGYVFERTDAGWVESAKLGSSDGDADDAFGGSVAIGGSTIVIGASADEDPGTSAGSVYVYQLTRSGWVEKANLTAPDAADFDRFGTSIAVDGTTIIIGSPGDDDDGSGSGSAYVLRGR